MKWPVDVISTMPLYGPGIKQQGHGYEGINTWELTMQNNEKRDPNLKLTGNHYTPLKLLARNGWDLGALDKKYHRAYYRNILGPIARFAQGKATRIGIIPVLRYPGERVNTYLMHPRGTTKDINRAWMHPDIDARKVDGFINQVAAKFGYSQTGVRLPIGFGCVVGVEVYDEDAPEESIEVYRDATTDISIVPIYVRIRNYIR